MARILVLSYDFRRTVVHDRDAMELKMLHNGFAPDDEKLIVCWSTRRESIRHSSHLSIEAFPAFLGAFRPFYDFLFIFVAPFVAR